MSTSHKLVIDADQLDTNFTMSLDASQLKIGLSHLAEEFNLAVPSIEDAAVLVQLQCHGLSACVK
jgi:hypothetical protein